MIFPIVILPSPSLHTPSRLLAQKELPLLKNRGVIENLIRAMYVAKGIGIAAPQVALLADEYTALVGEDIPDPAFLLTKNTAHQYGMNVALCIIGKEAFPKGFRLSSSEPILDEDLALINPSYERIGKKTVIEEEACLSVPGAHGPVKRWKDIRVSALLPNGTAVTFDAYQYFARVIQHEIDHLNGILFIDRASHVSRE